MIVHSALLCTQLEVHRRVGISGVSIGEGDIIKLIKRSFKSPQKDAPNSGFFRVVDVKSSQV